MIFFLNICISSDEEVNKNLQVNIKRVSASRGYCCYPNCRANTGLKVVSKQFRCHVAKMTKVYIPVLARACGNHIYRFQWSNVDDNIQKTSFKYTPDQIKDMFDLLTDNAINSTVIEREFIDFEYQLGIFEAIFNICIPNFYS